MNVRFRLLCVLLLAGSLFGCAQKIPQRTITHPAPTAQAESVWQQYLAHTATTNTTAPFSLSASFRFKTLESSNRASLKAWGNGNSPIRVDLLAPFGTVVASIRIGEGQVIIFEPEEKKAAYADSGSDVLIRLGLPVPVSIHHVMALLKGDYGSLFPQQYASAYLEGTSNVAYVFSSSTGSLSQASALTDGILILDANGYPMEWRQTAPKKFSIVFDKYRDGRPAKITVSSGSDTSALFLIKDRAYPAVPYSPQALTLSLPADTEVFPLSVRNQ
ncbi:MAG: hypothetical protein MI749_12545 [Desulfovibrionales bacterium]|nr:hypothetical protein [Desulfovibrionales bacterium]